jgi:hypothetical protein
MGDIETTYEYKIQMKSSLGEWHDVTEPMQSNGIFSLYKKEHGDDVRLVRRKITVGEWEVQK